MLFVDDIILIDESDNRVDNKLEVCKQALQSKGLKMSKTKTKYMWCQFSAISQEVDVEVMIGTQVIPKERSFKYLGSII